MQLVRKRSRIAAVERQHVTLRPQSSYTMRQHRSRWAFVGAAARPHYDLAERVFPRRDSPQPRLRLARHRKLTVVDGPNGGRFRAARRPAVSNSVSCLADGEGLGHMPHLQHRACQALNEVGLVYCRLRQEMAVCVGDSRICTTSLPAACRSAHGGGVLQERREV